MEGMVHMKKTRQFFSGVLAAMLILSLAAFGQTTHAAPAEGGVVSTAAGQIRGTRTEYGGSGNAGLSDIVAALGWI